MHRALDAGPDRLSPRFLRLLARTSISPENGVSGLSADTCLVRRLAQGDLPEQTVPLLAASTNSLLQPFADKIWPIAVRRALRPLVTKVLFPTTIEDTRDRLLPEQLTNAIPSGTDAIVHDCRMQIKCHGPRTTYIIVSVDDRNAFNTFSLGEMFVRLPVQTPSLAQFINLIYGRTKPDVVLPSSARRILSTQDGTQQGDPASMLFFSLNLQSLVRRLNQECCLDLNRWNDEGGTLVGPTAEFAKALRILRKMALLLGFMSTFRISVLTSQIFPKLPSFLFWLPSTYRYPANAALH